jgi:hypothetical protein
MSGECDRCAAGLRLQATDRCYQPGSGFRPLVDARGDTCITQALLCVTGGSALGRLKEERKQWRNEHPYGFYARPVAKETGGNNLMKWCVAARPLAEPAVDRLLQDVVRSLCLRRAAAAAAAGAGAAAAVAAAVAAAADATHGYVAGANVAGSAGSQVELGPYGKAVCIR